MLPSACRLLLARAVARAAPEGTQGLQLLAGSTALLTQYARATRIVAHRQVSLMSRPCDFSDTLCTRGFAAGAASAEAQDADPKQPIKDTGANAKLMKRALKITSLASPEIIAEPYAGPKPRQPLLSWFTASGWRERYQRILSEVKNLYALSRCTRDIKGFSMKSFKTEILGLYRKVNELFAAGDLTMLKRNATGKCFSLMKKELKAREKANWGRVMWALGEEPRLSDLELVQGRLMALDPNNPQTHFAQLTVKINTKHCFAAYDRKGKLVAGDPEAKVNVEEFWVVERAVGNPTGRWVLAARLNL